jgi:hypothetical protein
MGAEILAPTGIRSACEQRLAMLLFCGCVVELIYRFWKTFVLGHSKLRSIFEGFNSAWVEKKEPQRNDSPPGQPNAFLEISLKGSWFTSSKVSLQPEVISFQQSACLLCFHRGLMSSTRVELTTTLSCREHKATCKCRNVERYSARNLSHFNKAQNN